MNKHLKDALVRAMREFGEDGIVEGGCHYCGGKLEGRAVVEVRHPPSQIWADKKRMHAVCYFLALERGSTHYELVKPLDDAAYVALAMAKLES